MKYFVSMMVVISLVCSGCAESREPRVTSYEVTKGLNDLNGEMKKGQTELLNGLNAISNKQAENSKDISMLRRDYEAFKEKTLTKEGKLNPGLGELERIEAEAKKDYEEARRAEKILEDARKIEERARKAREYLEKKRCKGGVPFAGEPRQPFLANRESLARIANMRLELDKLVFEQKRFSHLMRYNIVDNSARIRIDGTTKTIERTGVNHDKMRQEKLHKIDTKIAEIVEAIAIEHQRMAPQ